MKCFFVALAVAAMAVLGLASPAGAEGELGVEVAGGEPLFDLESIAPGSTGSETLTITNNTSDPGDLLVQVVDLVDDENGCNEPELEYPDTTCEPDGGELSRDLLVTITDGAGATHYEGTVRELADSALLDTSLAGGDSIELTFDWEFVYSSPNDTQTDRVGFDIEVSLANDIEDAEVAGVSVSRGSPVNVLGAQLPRTGFDIGWIAQAGVAAILLGAAAKLLARRRS